MHSAQLRRNIVPEKEKHGQREKVEVKHGFLPGFVGSRSSPAVGRVCPVLYESQEPGKKQRKGEDRDSSCVRVRGATIRRRYRRTWPGRRRERGERNARRYHEHRGDLHRAISLAHYPAQDHADDQPTASEYDVDRHRYAERKRSIVEQRDEIEETDLDEVRRQRYRARFEARSRGRPCEVLRETVYRHDEELEKRDQRPKLRVRRGQLLERHRIAAQSKHQTMPDDRELTSNSRQKQGTASLPSPTCVILS